MPESSTIVIPTYNRVQYLEESLHSALHQTHAEEVRIIVLDNASTDATGEFMASIDDPRVEYVRNEVNLGMLGSLQRARDLVDSEYLCLLQDDDRLATDFIHRAATGLRLHPSAAFAYSRARIIDERGETVAEDDARIPCADGLISGGEYLEKIVDGENWVVHMSSALYRVSALAEAGWIDAPHSVHTLDFNLYYRLASRFDVFALAEVLACVRYHSSQIHRADPPGTGASAMLAERIDAVAHLLTKAGAEDSDYRRWLAERLLELNQRRSAVIADMVPGAGLSWEERLRLARSEIAAVVPEDAWIVLADDNQLPPLAPSRVVLPFIERNGEYWGPPENDDMAVGELERARATGARYFVVAWPAYWWLDYYRGFRRHVTTRYSCVVRSSRVTIFDLDITAAPASQRSAPSARPLGAGTAGRVVR